MLGVLEMVKLGITAAHDDAFFVPAPDPAAIGAVVQGCVDGGGRRWRWTSPT